MESKPKFLPGRARGRLVLTAGVTLFLAVSVGMPDVVHAANPPSPPDIGTLDEPIVVEPTTAPEPSTPPEPSNEPTQSPSPSPVATAPTTPPAPTAPPVTIPKPAPKPPVALNLFRRAGFRYQNPNYVACTATTVIDMLNFVSLGRYGGDGFRWARTLSSASRDRILAWERAHDTMVGGRGTDAHGWRNALNYFGWGTGALRSGSRVYEDAAFTSYAAAMKAAVRAMISTHKPVAMAAWAGQHAVMITGYYGLSGDPFAKDHHGRFTNKFSVAGFYLSDPLREDGRVNVRVSNASLGRSLNLKLRFRPYLQTDSPRDDPYTRGIRSSRSEWYAKWVLILPLR